MNPPAEFTTRKVRFGPLDAAVVSAGDIPPRQVVILGHGFGAPGTDLIPVAYELVEINRSAAPETLFVFPQAPLDLTPYGAPGGRDWWMIDIERFQQAMAHPEKLQKLRREIPNGMPEASALLRELVDEVHRQTGLPLSRFVLGGFSQGAILATDVTLRLPETPGGLCIFSGTLMAENEWTALAPTRTGLSVVQSHGRFDPILPFVAAESLRDVLQHGGLEVEFLPFAGAHTIPIQAMESLAQLIGRVAARI